jgi:hypothetical protein
LKKRFQQHKALAKRGGGYALHAAMRKYEANNFYIEEIESINSVEKAQQREEELISLNTRYPNGYNVHKGGLGGDTLSTHPRSLEIRQKMSRRHANTPRGSLSIHYKRVSEDITKGILEDYLSPSLPSVASICKTLY